MKNFELKTENGKLMIGEYVSQPRSDAGLCYFCGEPVWVSSGQSLTYYRERPTHKKCRKQKR